MTLTCGVDIGGTKILGGVVDEDGGIVEELRVESPATDVEAIERAVEEAQPGDLLYYADGGGGQAHIAVYLGNGQAVHGGFNGNETVKFSANVGSTTQR